MSLKGDKYENMDEVRLRLEGTVVMYDGKPVYVEDIRMPEGDEKKKDIARVFIRELPYDIKNKATRKFLSSRHFDLTPFKMGYCNFKQGCFLLSRAPIRQNRQGLSANSLNIMSVSNSPPQGLGGGGGKAFWPDLLKEQGFVDMVLGKYPTFKEAGEILNYPKINSVAISRSFAFEIDNGLDLLILYHKGVRCGVAMKGENYFRVSDKFKFLREELEEHRVPVAA